jgi:hypothetical protein
MRRRSTRASSVLVVTALGLAVSPLLTALGACSSFDAAPTAPNVDDGGALLAM